MKKITAFVATVAVALLTMVGSASAQSAVGNVDCMEGGAISGEEVGYSVHYTIPEWGYNFTLRGVAVTDSNGQFVLPYPSAPNPDWTVEIVVVSATVRGITKNEWYPENTVLFSHWKFNCYGMNLRPHRP